MKESEDKTTPRTFARLLPYFWLLIGIIGVTVSFYAFYQQLNLLAIAGLLNSLRFVVYGLTYFIKTLEVYRKTIKEVQIFFLAILMVAIFLSN